MVLKLDSRFAVVWRDPFSLQLGVDPAQVVLREVSTAQERMIAALGSGVSRSGLDMIASASGAPPTMVTALLRQLRPILLSDDPPAAPPTVSIVGAGQTVERIANALALAGAHVEVSAAVPAGERPVSDRPNTDTRADSRGGADLGIVIGHYVLDPDSYGYWLRRDIPHLPIVFGDESVMIGPLVDPGSTPCLYCLEHYRRDADASWAAIASQLWGRRSRSETPLVSSEVAVRATRMALARLASGRPSTRPLAQRSLAARSFRLAVDSGEVTRRDWMPHPECGCVALPADLSADRPGSDSPSDSVPPRTGAVVGERA